MVQLECSRTSAKQLTEFGGNVGCEVQLEVALLVHAIASGFSFAIAAFCLYHLIRGFQVRLAHFIVMGFSILLVASNVIALVLVARSFHTYIHFLLASAAITSDGSTTFPGPSIPEVTRQIELTAFEADLYLPIFFWVTDAFLLYRAWVIWHGKRLALIAPYFLYFVSLVSGIVCQALFARTKFQETPWIPALAFSSAVDVLTTSMIGGRLYYHHRRQAKAGLSDSKFFVAALIICVESGLMSTVSKLIQFAIPISDRALTVVPFCTVASNLIILRKALGAENARAKTETKLSDLRFRSRHQISGIATLSSMRSPVGVESRVQFERPGLDTVDSIESRPGSVHEAQAEEKKRAELIKEEV